MINYVVGSSMGISPVKKWCLKPKKIKGVPVEIKVVSGDITRSVSQAIVLGYFEASERLEGEIAIVDEALEGAITQLIKQGDIKGKLKETTLLYSLGRLPSSKVVILGLGKKSDLNPEKIRVIIAGGCKFLRQKNVENIDSAAFGIGTSGLGTEVLGQAMAEGALLGTYTFRKHKTKPGENKEIKEFRIVESDAGKVAALEKGCWKGKIIAEAAILVRDMVNEPSNILTPTVMAEMAGQLAQKYGLEFKVIEREEMRTLGMGGLLGVSQGSQQPPKFIILTYKGKDTDEIDIVLVGKGITFDSGGISIKPSENMGDMKGDMAGGASVMGAISAVAQFKPKINVAAIIPATENLPSGTALKPGDIITFMNGKTAEIISTDAEGRLILADGLIYARQMGAKRMIDVATLTGACSVALGNVCTGAFSNNQELVGQVISAGAEAGECIWQMPMNEEYKEQNNSDVADIKNTGGRLAGAITAAWFLGEFVESIPWVHLDIAGTSMLDRDRGYLIKGATGVTVRTMINLVLSLAEKYK
jgi:leucyl aminopeptidase